MPFQTWPILFGVPSRCVRTLQSAGSFPGARPPQATASSVPNAEDYRFEWDLSAVHAFRARRDFIDSIRHGEAAAKLAQAAVATAAEDDAVATHSTVPFPQEAYLARIDRLAAECQTRVCVKLSSNTTPTEAAAAIQNFLQHTKAIKVASSGRSNLPEDSVVDHRASLHQMEASALLLNKDLFDRSNPVLIIERSSLNKAFCMVFAWFDLLGSTSKKFKFREVKPSTGVWEEPKDAYINELLIRKCGHASVVAVLMNEVFRKLFEAKAIDFLVTLNCGSFDRFPVPVPLALPRPALLLQDSAQGSSTTDENSSKVNGEPVNTCSVDALHEMLSHHKRAFWPFAWDTGRQYSIATRPLLLYEDKTDAAARESRTSSDLRTSSSGRDNPSKPLPSHALGSFGGFLAAASEAVHGPANSYIQVISRAARNRLQRGIWTSPGAGDIRRAVAACERLVLLTSSCRFSFVGAEEDEQGPDVCGQLEAFERRDLGALYLHGGMLAEAKVEFLAFQSCRDCHRDTMQVRKDEDEMLRDALEFLNDVDTSGFEPLTAESWLRRKEPSLDELDKRPLSW